MRVDDRGKLGGAIRGDGAMPEGSLLLIQACIQDCRL